MIIRKLVSSDLPDILRIQQNVYRPELLESSDTFSRKLMLFPEGCLGCEDDGVLCAYVFAHPWQGDSPVPLDDSNLLLPPKPDALYIHDLAVETAYRGRGLAQDLFGRLLRLAEEKGLGTMSLVAVQNSETFWQRLGFKRGHALSYGPGVSAVFMVR
jgi:ribosomal protein S18 acetylase RimI-like enzyme